MKTAVFLFFFSCTLSAQQDFGWLRNATGSGDEAAIQLCTDANSNVIVTGNFNSASAVVSGSTISNAGINNRDVLLAKYDALGNLLWCNKFGGAGDDEGISVCTDANGNIYVGGQYDGPTINFGSVTLNNASGFTDVYLAKYNAQGVLQWAKSYGGNLSENLVSVKADNNAVYFAGTFRSLSVSFGSYGVVNSGNADAFIVKADAAGNALWARQVGGTQDDQARDLSIDNNGNVFVCGDFNSSTLSTYSVSSAGGYDIFLGKYDASGNFLMARVIGASLNETARAIASDAAGNIILSGTFESSALNLTTVTLNNSSGYDMFLLKTNSTFVTTWANRNAGSPASYVLDLNTDANNNLYLCGKFDNSSLQLGSTTLSNPNTSGEGFFATLDGGGNWLNARSTNSNGDEAINSVMLAGNGNLFICGYFDANLVMGTHTLSISGGRDLLLAELCDVPSAPQVSSSLNLCGGQTAVLTATPPAGNTINWYSAAAGGSPVFTATVSINVSSAGTWYAASKSVYSGCVSATRVAVSVSVQPLPLVTISGKTLSASQGSMYKWIECAKDSVLGGQNGQTLILPHTGWYAAIVTNNGCTDTSTCKFYSVDVVTGTVTVPPDPTVTVTGILTQSDRQIVVYPNPSAGQIFIKCGRSVEFEITDASGRIVFQKSVSPSGEPFIIDLPGAGLYFFSTSAGERRRLVVSP